MEFDVYSLFFIIILALYSVYSGLGAGVVDVSVTKRTRVWRMRTVSAHARVCTEGGIAVSTCTKAGAAIENKPPARKSKTKAHRLHLVICGKVGWAGCWN